MLWLAGVPRRFRLAAFILVNLALGYLVVITSAGFVLSGVGAPAAAALGFSNARARADFAQLLYARQISSPRQLDRQRLRYIERSATNVLRRDVLVPSAWRLLGMIRAASGERPGLATRLFEASNVVSRRDLGTRLLLFEQYAKAGRAPEAFHQLDLALRQSDRGRSTILPILAGGVADRQVQPMLRKALVAGVSWRDDFYLQLAQSPLADDTLAAFFASLPRQATSGSEQALRLVAASLVQKGDYRAARAALARIGQEVQHLSNGGFEEQSANPPLDWEFQSTPDYDAAQGSYGGAIEGKAALYLRASPGVAAQVARKVLFLSPGLYRLSALAGEGQDPPLTEANLIVACATANGAVGHTLGKLAFINVGPRQRQTTTIAVPPGDCTGQWMMVTLQGSAASESGAWLDSITLTPEIGHDAPVG